MQSFDAEKLVATNIGTEKQIQQKIDEFQNQLRGKPIHHVIGKLPKVNDFIEINGLQYRITYVDKKKGNVRLKLRQPKR